MTEKKTATVKLTADDLKVIIEDLKESISLWQKSRRQANPRRIQMVKLTDKALHQIVLCDKEIKSRQILIETLSEHWRAII